MKIAWGKEIGREKEIEYRRLEEVRGRHFRWLDREEKRNESSKMKRRLRKETQGEGDSGDCSFRNAIITRLSAW